MGSERGVLSNQLSLMHSAVKKIGWPFLVIIVVDFIFYASSLFVFYKTWLLMKAKEAELNIPTTLVDLSTSQAQELLTEAQGFFHYLITLSITSLLIVLLLYTVCKGVIWNLTLKQKHSLLFYPKFLLFNLLWVGPLVILNLLVLRYSDLSQPLYGFYIILFVSYYFVTITSSIFALKPKWSSWVRGIKLSLARFPQLVFPFILFLVGFLLMIFFLRLAKLPNIQLLHLTFFVAYLGLARYYLSTVILRLNKKI